MKKNKIKFYNSAAISNIVTGGHKYDKDLFDIINLTNNYEAETAILNPDKEKSKIKTLFKEIINGIKNRKAEIIVFNSSKCLRFLVLFLILKFIFSKNVYVIHHHFIYKEFKGIKRILYKYSEKLFLRLSNKIIVPSPYIYSVLKAQKINTKRLILWQIPFDMKPIYVSEPQKGNLTYAGTIEPRKGIIYLLKALKYLKEDGLCYKTTIIGKVVNEKYFDELKQFIRENKLNVEFKGFITKEEKEKIFSETDVFVFPSLLEGYGMVLIEAQVYGLPIISFDNSAMPFNVKNDLNGYTVPTGDYQQFAESIKKIVEDRKLREKFSLGAYDNLKYQNNFREFKKDIINYFDYQINKK